MNKFSRQKGFSQIILLVIISFLAISLPIATKLVQKSQENRSKAAEVTTCYCYKGSSQGVRQVGGAYSSKASCTSACSGGACQCKTTNTSTPTPTPYIISGTCGSTKNGCLTGAWKDAADTEKYYVWTCGNRTCTLPVASDVCSASSGRTLNCACTSGSQCDSGFCSGGFCKTKCTGETDRSLACGCSEDKQCASGLCKDGLCYTATCTGTTDRSLNCKCTKGTQCASLFCKNDVCSEPKVNMCGGSNGMTTKVAPAATMACKVGSSLSMLDGKGEDGSYNWTCTDDVTRITYSCSARNTNTTKCGVKERCKDNAEKKDLPDSETHYLWQCDDEICSLPTLDGGGCKDGRYLLENGVLLCKDEQNWFCNNGIVVKTSCDNGCINGECKCSANGSTYAAASVICGINNDPDNRYVCSNGQWLSAGKCKDANTPGSCTPKTKKCSSGSEQQICDENGIWGKATKCDSGVCIAETGECQSSGSPGPDGPPDVTPSVSPTPTGIGATGAKLSFKIAFDGVAQTTDFTCLNNFKTVKLVVGKVGSSLTEEKTVDITKTTGVGSESSKKYVIFEANNVVLGAGFSGATNVYARIKGQVHASMYYCTKGQSAKNTSQVCNLALDGTVNNFYEYPVLGGDVNQDGKVDTTDFSVIKNDLNKVGCEYKSDLNGDGKVNGPDIKIHKTALESKYDE